nr:MAG TPA: hypothetical protein [Caudoviricetes sp.]
MRAPSDRSASWISSASFTSPPVERISTTTSGASISAMRRTASRNRS